jgi:23S rRNA (adenine2503-C2)-methyltransferase
MSSNLTETRCKAFANGKVYALQTEDGYPIETTDTFLPDYTRDAVGRKQNKLDNTQLGDRTHRWMIGVSVMSGCPVRCKFCATGQLKRWRPLTAEEIVAQVDFIVAKNPDYKPREAQEFKINYTRMGEPFLNIDEVRRAIQLLDKKYKRARLHHYVSTIGIEGMNVLWVKDNITLQISLHSLDPGRRDWLIPYKKKAPIPLLGLVRTGSFLKTTLNLTLVDEEDFDIERLTRWFDPEHFFIKLSPINTNETSERWECGQGIIEGRNLV